MKQDGRVLTKTMGPGNSQLNAMFEVIKGGMAFVTGYWFDPSMNWLDGDECGSGPETCDNAPAWISNWQIYTTPPGPAPTPPPVVHDGKCCWNSCSGCVSGMD